ncbi:hypothetical protein [Mycolicibacterium porcinum]|uniref:hypothetical protein n=1 Tax=Mycolicibacterium porcinum TaxID=39693 RepID=UPI000A51BF34|nr:hypothetical protein [Mycolicibacterium porcinum]
MEAVARSYLLAGVALVGAGAIAVGPIQPLPPDVQVPAMPSSAVPVELNALVNPIELWANVISKTVTNVGDIAETVLANPAPILGKIGENGLISADVFAAVATTFVSGFVTGVGNVPQQIHDAIRYGILEGNIYDGVLALATSFLSPVVGGAFGALMHLPDVIAVLQNPFVNAASVIETAVNGGIVNVGFPLLTNVLAPVAQIGLTGQAIYDGIQAGDFEAVANAVISFPSDLVNTVLNGNPDIGVGGILGSEGGLVPGLLAFRQAIADAIHPPVLSTPLSRTVADAPDLKAASVTLDTGEIAGAQSRSAAEGAGSTGVVADSASDGASGSVAADDDVATDDETPKSNAGEDVVKASPVVKPGRIGPDTNRQHRGADAVKSLRTDVQKSVKNFGDKVSKALGGKAKAEKKAAAASGGGDE